MKKALPFVGLLLLTLILLILLSPRVVASPGGEFQIAEGWKLVGPPPPVDEPENPRYLDIWVDRGEGSTYQIGEPITVCYRVPYAVYIRIWSITSSGWHLVIQGFDDGTGDCLRGTVGEPEGRHTLRIEMIENGQVSDWDETWFWAEESTVPIAVDIWVRPRDRGEYQIGDRIQLCYDVSRSVYVRIWKITSEGRSVLIEGVDDGTGGCLDGIVGEPLGRHTFRIEAIEGGRIADWDETWIDVVGEPVPPPPCRGNYDVDIDVSPWQPKEGDNINVRISGTSGDVCVPEYLRHEVRGSVIHIYADERSCRSGIMCSQVVTGWSFDVPVGYLSPGTYSVAFDLQCGSDTDQCERMSFTVRRNTPTPTRTPTRTPTPTPTRTRTPTPTRTPTATPQPPARIPVVVVPGYYATFCIPGTQTCWFYPVVAKGVYEPLWQAFNDAGYTKDQDFFYCLYNWALSNTSSANKLGDCVDKALRKNPRANKVHIITHSNGGNVARAYIQNRADPHVDKLLMIAPPNQGVVRAYWPWEGGDISQESLGIQARIRLFIMTVYAEPSRDCTVFPQFSQRCIYRTMHESAPSGRELLPVGASYLTHYPDRRAISPGQMTEKNTFLTDLNGRVSSLFTRVRKVVIYAASGHYTEQTINVQDRSWWDGPLWVDGKPSATLGYIRSTDGDGTIQRSRAQLPSCPSDKCSFRGSFHQDHIGIVAEVRNEILGELGLATATESAVTVNTRSEEPNVLFFVARTSARFLVIDPHGRQVGYRADGRFVNQIPGAEYAGEEGSAAKLIAIPNPAHGEYQTQLSGTNLSSTEAYTVGSVWNRNAQVELLQTGEIRPGETKRETTRHRGFTVLMPFIAR